MGLWVPYRTLDHITELLIDNTNLSIDAENNLSLSTWIAVLNSIFHQFFFTAKTLGCQSTTFQFILSCALHTLVLVAAATDWTVWTEYSKRGYSYNLSRWISRQVEPSPSVGNGSRQSFWAWVRDLTKPLRNLWSGLSVLPNCQLGYGSMEIAQPARIGRVGRWLPSGSIYTFIWGSCCCRLRIVTYQKPVFNGQKCVLHVLQFAITIILESVFSCDRLYLCLSRWSMVLLCARMFARFLD